MRSLRLIPIALAAIAVPVLLALGVHFAAGSSLTAPPAVVARVPTAPIATPSVEPETTTTRTTTTSGRCAEPEHRNEPRCVSGGSVSSGRGSDSSGKGRSGSGRSGGDD
jgi:uncharacterized membrane protein YgcG